jgi:hypothetical protein
VSGGAAALILALAALPGRDHAAGALLLAGALALAARGRGLRRGLALGAALAGLVCFLPVARTQFGHTAGVFAGDAAFLSFTALVARRALREARPGPVRWVALLPALSCIGSWVAPNMRIAILASATFTRFAVLFGLALFVYAAATRQRSLESLAFASLASCFFPGWRTLLLVLLEGWMLGSPGASSPPARLRGAMAPLACLTLLVLFSGGYGLSRIDLTLIVLGDTDPVHPGVAWGAAAVLLSYSVSLVAALRLSVRTAGGPLADHVAYALSAFVLFTGADLLWLAAARPGVLLTIQLEEQLVFDVVLSALLLVLAAATALIERGAPALREASA